MEAPIKILIADDHLLLRIAMRKILSNFHENCRIIEAENGEYALEICLNECPDILFLDIDMPVMDGFECLRKIRASKLQLKVIMLSHYTDPLRFHRLMQMGIEGYLSKDAPEIEINTAIQSILSGLKHYDKQLYAEWQSKYGKNSDELQEQNLSNRELEILNGICRQKSTREIAESLYIAENTVNNHRRNIMEKTGINNSIGLVVFAIKNGLYWP